jgi:hypothetical protein
MKKRKNEFQEDEETNAKNVRRGGEFNNAITNNSKMHPRNVFAQQRPDFAELAALYPSLQPL